MHYCLEIIMPNCPEDEIKDRVSEILDPFSENNEDSTPTFWDWWQIGGRYSGCKITDVLDEDKLEDFCSALKENKVTVSSVVAGKETLKPESQIPLVDKLWKEFFPDYPGEHCPLFSHAGSELSGDVIKFKDLHPETTAFRVIIAGPTEAEYMTQRDIWNGVTHVKTDWDGKLMSAVQAHLARIKRSTDDYRERVTPKDDWWVVTVDYHS